MFNSLRFAVNKTLLLYQDKGRAFYEFSIKFCIGVNLLSWICTAVVAVIAGFIFYDSYDAFLNGLFRLDNPESVAGIGRSFTILSFGLYAIYLDRITDEGFVSYLSISDFKRNIFRDDMVYFSKLLLILFALEIASHKPLSGYFQLNESQQVLSGLLNLLQRLIYFFDTYISYIFASLILIRSNSERINRDVLVNYKSAIIVSSLLMFALYSISNSVYSLVQYLIYPVIDFALGITVLSACLKLFFVIVVPPIFFLGFASAIYFPFIGSFRSLQVFEEKSPLDNDSTFTD
jgi:hypothetical protein